MHWLTTLVICVLAGLFAASGVRKATADDAGSWQVAHGVVRIVFSVFVIGGAVWKAARHRPAEPTPPPPAGPGTPPDGGS